MKLDELMQDYCSGCQRAFQALYASTAPSVFGELLRRTGDRNVSERLTQQVFLRLHRARSAYVAGADPMGWILALAERELRRHRRAETVELVPTAGAAQRRL